MKHYFSHIDAAIDSLNTISQQQAAWARRLDERHQSLLKMLHDALFDFEDEEPLMHMLLHNFNRITDVRERLNVIDDFKDTFHDYLKKKGYSEEETKEYMNHYAALRHYIDFIDDLLRDEKIKEIYYQHTHSSATTLKLDANLYYFVLENNRFSEEFVWLAQAIYYYAHYQEEITLDATDLPIYTYRFKDKMIHPAPFFCLSLLEAARFRRRVLEGIDEPFSVKDFPLELRNACFDIYIRHQTEEKMKSLKKNFDRPLEVTMEEAQSEFLDDELLVYNTAKNDPDLNEDVVRMTELFIAYLKNEMGIDDLSAAKKQPYCTYIVPNAPKSRDEIEADVEMASKRSAQRFANRLLVLERLGYMNFMGDSPKEIFEYLKERYNLPYSADNFIRYFKPE